MRTLFTALLTLSAVLSADEGIKPPAPATSKVKPDDTELIVAVDKQGLNWPQWRGSNRDAKAVFNAPESWPAKFTEQWQLTVGNGVATPALVGNKLYVFPARTITKSPSVSKRRAGKNFGSTDSKSKAPVVPPTAFRALAVLRRWPRARL
jgi:hypothetical protein